MEQLEPCSSSKKLADGSIRVFLSFVKNGKKPNKKHSIYLEQAIFKTQNGLIQPLGDYDYEVWYLNWPDDELKAKIRELKSRNSETIFYIPY